MLNVHSENDIMSKRFHKQSRKKIGLKKDRDPHGLFLTVVFLLGLVTKLSQCLPLTPALSFTPVQFKTLCLHLPQCLAVVSKERECPWCSKVGPLTGLYTLSNFNNKSNYPPWKCKMISLCSTFCTTADISESPTSCVFLISKKK